MTGMNCFGPFSPAVHLICKDTTTKERRISFLLYAFLEGDQHVRFLYHPICKMNMDL